IALASESLSVIMCLVLSVGMSEV
ncbi:MAG: hypothetical protein RL197_840, partial [Actinomycetota bacterium]